MSTEAFLIISLVLLAVNLLSFLLFRSDKLRARQDQWRISEGTLLLVAFFGPFGAYWAMRRYRHKTKHLKFLLVPLFLVLQSAGMVFLELRFHLFLG